MKIGPKIKNGGLLSCRTATIRFFWSKYIGNHINILITDQCVQKNPKKPVFYMKNGPKKKCGIFWVSGQNTWEITLKTLKNLKAYETPPVRLDYIYYQIIYAS